MEHIHEEPCHFVRKPIGNDFSGTSLGGRYILHQRIGYGATASIYTATDNRTHGQVAVKVLHPQHHKDERQVARFVQEGQLAAQIRHPRLVAVHDIGLADELDATAGKTLLVGGVLALTRQYYLVMELVSGPNLATALKSGPMDWRRSTNLVLDLLAGLSALHERGVAHRDISPNNCILESVDGVEHARLPDLGYARLIAPRDVLVTSDPCSVAQVLFGTPHYIAPERLEGKPGDYRADLFSIGALWYTMLTGHHYRLPFDVPSGMSQSVSVPGPRPEELPLPRPVRAVLLGALEAPERRHHSAASMADALRAALRVVDVPPARHSALRLVAPALALLLGLVSLRLTQRETGVDCPEPPSVAQPEATAAIVAEPEPPPAIEPAPAPQVVASPVASEQPAAPPDEPQADLSANPPSKKPLGDGLAALRKKLIGCKPFPSARFELELSPAGEIKLNGGQPMGKAGQCVRDVLEGRRIRRAMKVSL